MPEVALGVALDLQRGRRGEQHRVHALQRCDELVRAAVPLGPRAVLLPGGLAASSPRRVEARAGFGTLAVGALAHGVQRHMRRREIGGGFDPRRKR